ncbi:hypothetical protein P4B35_09935 [Pontiellaceae bacterium B12227]|nr:hypothetical protein [Pontiellaceae bacterium B12227]
MLKFPILGREPEPPVRKMTSHEFIQYCEFCLENNSRITPENCLARKTGEEAIKIPFRL